MEYVEEQQQYLGGIGHPSHILLREELPSETVWSSTVEPYAKLKNPIKTTADINTDFL